MPIEEPADLTEPHPDQPRAEITETGYGRDCGVLRMKLSPDTAGYIPRQWNVDCSPDHSIHGLGSMLWQRDLLAMDGVKNAMSAPGYSKPNTGGKRFG